MLFFGFQRCVLSFSDTELQSVAESSGMRTRTAEEVEADEMMFPDVSYMVLARDKGKTYSILEKIRHEANIARSQNVTITNKDNELINAVMATALTLGVDHDVTYYQMLHQVWRKRPGYVQPRTIIILPAMILLCEEDLTSLDVHLEVLDTASFKDVYKIVAEDSPLKLTLIFKSKRSLGARRKWRLKAENRKAIERLQDEIRRGCVEHGNTSI